MERVVTINLNGNPYQLEEPAYDAVRSYLARAEAALTEDPDKAEVVRDLEQAIADKCASYLSPSKTVIAASEMTKVLEEMGPVEGDAAPGAAPGADANSGGPRRRRLFRIRDGAQVAGVCAGMAAFFDLDVNIVRLLFIIATILTSGAAGLIYVAMMFLIPSAHTSEEWAAAHGVPFNAQEVIDRAKREYHHFTDNGPPWGWTRWQRRQWKREMRARWRGSRWRGGSAFTAAPPSYPPPPAGGPVSAVGGAISGVLLLVISTVRVALGIAFFILLIAIATDGGIGDWHLPPHVSTWEAILGLILIYVVISIPLRASLFMLRGGGYGYGYYHRGEGLLGIAIFVAIAWLAYMYVPEARDFMDQIPEGLRRIGEALRQAFDATTTAITTTTSAPPAP